MRTLTPFYAGTHTPNCAESVKLHILLLRDQEMVGNPVLDLEVYGSHMRSTAPAAFRAEMKIAIHQLIELKGTGRLASGTSKRVFGRTGVRSVLNAVNLTVLMRTGLNTTHVLLGDWLAKIAQGDAEKGIDEVQRIIKEKNKKDWVRLEDQVTAISDLVDALYWIVDALRRPESDAVRPYCILCWRHPRVAGDRKYCLEHSPECEIVEKRERDYRGYAQGRRQMLRIAKALGIVLPHHRINSLSSAIIFSELKRRHDKIFISKELRKEPWNTILDNSDLFRRNVDWVIVAWEIAKFAKYHMYTHRAFGDLNPNVQWESRDQWLNRILGAELLDDLDAFDDIVKYPIHLAGLIARHNLYLLGLELIAKASNESSYQSRRAEVMSLRAEGLSFRKIGETLGISGQRAHIICKGRSKKHDRVDRQAAKLATRLNFKRAGNTKIGARLGASK